MTVFHTDHGEYLGDFGMVEKWPSGLDECLLRNPLIVAGPGVAEGGVAGALVEMVDLPATVAELAEVQLGHRHFGRSFTTLLTDPGTAHRDRAFSEGGFRIDEADQNEQPDHHPYLLKGRLQQERPDLVGRAIAVRTDEWTYVHRVAELDELYNRTTDPHEVTNLAADPAHAARCRTFRDDILEWLVTTSDVIPSRRDPRMDDDLVGQFLGGTRAFPPPP